MKKNLKNPFEGWKTGHGDGLRPRKGDFVVSYGDSIRIFRDFKTTIERVAECEKLYEEYVARQSLNP